jgi:ATP-binding cassette, subfamily B, bacterial
VLCAEACACAAPGPKPAKARRPEAVLDVLKQYAQAIRRALALMMASPLRPWLWVAGVAIVAARIAPILAAWVAGQALNEFQHAIALRAFTDRLIALGALMAVFTLARSLYGAAAHIVQERIDLDVDMHFEIIEARKLAGLDTATRENPKFQDLHENAKRGGAQIMTQMLQEPAQIVGNIGGLVTAVALLAQQSWLYVALIVSVSIPFFWTEYRAGRREYESRWSWTPRRRAYYKLLNAIAGIGSALELRVLGSLDRVVEETVQASKDIKQQQLDVRRRGVIENLVVSLVVALSVGALAVMIVRDCISGALQMGTAVFLMTSLWQVSEMFAALYKETAQIARTRRGVEDYLRFLDWAPVVVSPPDGWTIAPDEPVEIEFADVSFRYPGRDDFALRNVTCAFKIGERIGVVGKNGSGKSTFVKLLLRVYDPTSGCILYNGRDLREADLASLYRGMSVLSQDVELYEFATVAGNVELGAPEPLERAALDRALAASEADMFVQDLPKGLETSLGREFGGVKLSGGQAQRIGIARALYKNPRILVLDEPTSAIDAISEQIIFDRLMGDKADARLTICISHRFTTLARADCILVFEQGRIVEQGAPAQLKTAGGPYQALLEAQTKLLM